MAEEDFDIYDWKHSSIPPVQQDTAAKLFVFEESLLCSICQELYTNPHLLKCGHTYCSLCIRGHMDTAVGTNSALSSICPICKKSCDRSDLRPNRAMESTVLVYKGLRNDVLGALKSGAQGVPVAGDSTPDEDDHVNVSVHRRSCNNNNNNNSSSSSSSVPITSNTPVEMKPITAKVLHGLNKGKVQQLLQELCRPAAKGSRINVEGDLSDLKKRYQNIILLHNSQIGSSNPLSWDQIVEHVSRAERAARRNYKGETRRVEDLLSGKIDQAAKLKFKQLTEMIKARSVRAQSGIQDSCSSFPQDPFEQDANQEIAPVHITIDGSGGGFKPQSQGILKKKRREKGTLSMPSQTDEASEQEQEQEQKLEIRCSGIWRLVCVEGSGELFFYNTVSKIAQSLPPPELSHLTYETFCELPKARFVDNTISTDLNIGLVATVSDPPPGAGGKRSSPSQKGAGEGGAKRRKTDVGEDADEADEGGILSITETPHDALPAASCDKVVLLPGSAVGGWTCDTCTFDNPSLTAAKCEMCNKPRPLGKPTRATANRSLSSAGTPGNAAWALSGKGRSSAAKGKKGEGVNSSSGSKPNADNWIDSKMRRKT